MATTTNYGWTTPDDTALVKDGAAAIRTLGTSVDTTTKNLNPSTTLGDIEYRSSSANVNTRLGVGTTGQVLTVTGGVPTWADPAAGAPVFIGCSVFKSANQSLSNETGTILTFDLENYDTDGFHDNSVNNSRITIPAGKGGKYLFTAWMNYATNATGTRGFNFVKNGSTAVASLTWVDANSESTRPTRIAGSAVLDLVATDYIEMEGYQKSGGNLNVLGDSANSALGQFQCTYLGA
jgi:hypothetical protein